MTDSESERSASAARAKSLDTWEGALTARERALAYWEDALTLQKIVAELRKRSPRG